MRQIPLRFRVFSLWSRLVFWLHVRGFRGASLWLYCAAPVAWQEAAHEAFTWLERHS